MKSSFIRWAGSKRKLIPIIKNYWNIKYSRYFEPFMGSAQLFLYLKPSKAILSDINTELVEAFLEVRKNPNEVYRQVRSFPINKKFYYELRAQDLSSLSKIQKAARFFYLNRYCFNGLYRVNTKGEFNVPYGGRLAGRFPNEKEFLATANLLRNAKFYNADFEKIILEKVKKNDFVYLDPPYTNNNKRIFNTYGNPTSNTTDIIRLQRTIEHIDKIGAKFLLSYSYNKEVKDLFSKWKKKRVLTSRSIAGFLNARKRIAEILITNIDE